MARTGGHKALVPVTDAEWRAFRVLVFTLNTTVAAELARLVRSAIACTGVAVDVLSDAVEGQLAIDEALEEKRSRRLAAAQPAEGRSGSAAKSSTSSRSSTRPRSSSPAKAKANKRSSKPKKERPKRC